MIMRDQAAFDELAGKLRAAGAFGVDTEFIREKTYRPRLCLIQVAIPGTCVAVDPFEVRDLGALLRLIEDPQIEKVVHAGQQDMEIFHALSGKAPRNVFDTQIAASLLGHGESIGYSRLLEEVLGVRLQKSETFTDWARRPLTDGQVEYALSDVRHLLEMRERLGEELVRHGRLEWLREELRAYEDESYYRPDPRNLYRRVSGVGKLNRRELAVLRELTAWREEEAAARDRPRGWILSDSILIEVARRSPQSPETLETVRGLNRNLLRRSGAAIVERVRRGLECPREERPALVEKRLRDDGLAAVVDLLEVVLKARASEERVTPGLLATRRDLTELARAALDGTTELKLPVLEGWRGNMVGDDLRALLGGRLALRVDPATGRIASDPI